MQPLPSTFLETIAKQYELSPEQTEALIKRLGDPQREQDDAEALHISVNALQNRMSGVYSKFSISGKGPGKLRRLHDFLSAQYRKGDSPAQDGDKPQADIEAIVQTIRQQVRDDIHHRCGTMRVLDMEQPIGIGDIYTNVNILEKLSGRRRLGLNELLQDCDLENFDRFLLGQIRHERVPGLESVERHRQLMVLGKPGAGKTTFMKRLATLCNHGEFQAGRVPVFVTLKEFAEAKGQPDLQTYIGPQLAACGVEDTEALVQILGAGRSLILLDGLDEVQETDHDRILQEIKAFTGQYRDCQFVMTCRIAAWGYKFEKFTDVEIADFDDEQIAEFAAKWFKSKGVPEKAKNFTQRLNENEQIRELANSPLLLTLLCLIFEERDDFLPNRAELYEEGIRLLLKKWDADREIKRDQVYKKLSLQCKEELFGQLAFKTFERGEYFFKQSVVEQHIFDYIRNLPGVQEDEETLQLDSEAVLKSIEAQHGLLVERARGIYSFSHLTFQEYFTARHITRSKRNPLLLSELAFHATEKRYREIFSLAVTMLSDSTQLLQLMKNRIDEYLEKDASLKSFLVWVQSKAKSIKTVYKQTAIRMLYFELAFERLIIAFTKQGKVYRPKIDSPGIIDSKISTAINFDVKSDFYIDLMLYRSLSLMRAVDLNWIRAIDLNVLSEKPISSPQFRDGLLAIQASIPSNEGDFQALRNWWLDKGKDLETELRSLLARYRNIGHDWQFTEAQKEKLQQYYDANRLLVECLNSDCCVTEATRQYIEDTLLLPMSEIEKIPVPSR